jgi:2-iminobutanoate/2-iminopropanoate deaminase
MSGEARRVVQTDRAPAAVGPYNQGIVSGGLFYSAGQIGLDPETGSMVGDDVESQTRQVLSNLAAVLGAAGSGFGQVLRTTVYLADMADFAAMNAIYAEAFGEAPPARSTVAVSGLPLGARVEMDVIARVV